MRWLKQTPSWPERQAALEGGESVEVGKEEGRRVEVTAGAAGGGEPFDAYAVADLAAGELGAGA